MTRKLIEEFFLPVHFSCYRDKFSYPNIILLDSQTIKVYFVKLIILKNLLFLIRIVKKHAENMVAAVKSRKLSL